MDSIEHFGHNHEFTRLVIDLKGKDPDDAFSSVPYEKGFNFLYHLETLVGKTKFDRFIPHVSSFWLPLFFFFFFLSRMCVLSVFT